jgi:hypothetical protein
LFGGLLSGPKSIAGSAIRVFLANQKSGLVYVQTPCHDRAALEVENMTLTNVIELAIAVVVIVLAIRFFMKRG